jgi:hypothetical protein
MAVLNLSDQLTAIEIIRRANDPERFHIVELLRMTNQLLADVPAYQANNGAINVTTQRLVKEYGQHRIYNQGTGKVATQTKTVQDRIAILAAYSDVDRDQADTSGNPSALRQSEAMGIIKGMGLTQAQTCIYGDESKPEEFAGMFTRRNSLADPDVINAGGTGGNLTSIYLVAVGRDLFHLIYPQGASGIGIRREDRGVIDALDAAGKEFPAYREYFEAQYGITVRAPDALKRICNIPATMTGGDLVDIILETRRKMPPGASTYAMYSNVDVLIKIDKEARDKGNVIHTAADPWGDEITHIRDIRCRQMDIIINTESQVV